MSDVLDHLKNEELVDMLIRQVISAVTLTVSSPDRELEKILDKGCETIRSKVLMRML